MKRIIWTLGISMSLAAGCGGKKTSRPGGHTGGGPAAPAATTDAPDVRGGSDSVLGGRSVALVHFALDQHTLDEQARRILGESVTMLLESDTAAIRVEGHADERGGTQYNLALSVRRAESVRRYLVDRGVPALRLSTLGFGEERPAVPGHGEFAWEQNRRAEVLILPSSVAGKR